MPGSQTVASKIGKPWSSSKKEILKWWSAMPQGIPTPPISKIPKEHRGSTLPYDGVRINGSQAFITSVVSRIKDLLQQENENSKLNVVFRQQETKNGSPIPSYVFYVNVRDR